MKKLFASLLLITFMVSMLSACSIPGETPAEGLWYCNELGISIDFSLLAEENTPECAKLYIGEGAAVDILCYFDYGTGISLMSLDQETDYFNGSFEYKNGNFTVTSHVDKKQYVFARMSDSGTLFWVPEESQFVDYTIDGDLITFRYAICFINDSTDNHSIKLSAKFHAEDLSGWTGQHDFLSGCDENGEWVSHVIPNGEKVVHTYCFTVPYSGGTVNTDIQFPEKIILSTSNVE